MKKSSTCGFGKLGTLLVPILLKLTCICCFLGNIGCNPSVSSDDKPDSRLVEEADPTERAQNSVLRDSRIPVEKRFAITPDFEPNTKSAPPIFMPFGSSSPSQDHQASATRNGSRADPLKVQQAKDFRSELLTLHFERKRIYETTDAHVRTLQNHGRYRDAERVKAEFFASWEFEDSFRRQALKVESKERATVYASRTDSHLAVGDCWPFARRSGDPAGILHVAAHLEDLIYLVLPVEGEFLEGDFVVVK